MLLRFILSIVIFINLVSCSYFEKEQEMDAVVQMGDAYLTRSEIQTALPIEYTSNDSILIVQKFIDDWVTDQMILKNARNNISSEKQSSLDLLISRYRTELYTQAYLQELIKQNLDTTIPQSQIKDYYKDHKQEFILNEDLVKFKYVWVDQTYSQMDNLKKWFKSNSKINMQKVDSLALSYRNYSLNDSIWIKKSLLMERVSPIDASNEKEYLIPQRSWVLEDSLGVYLLRFNDILRRGDQAPITYVSPTIKQILRNQRKLEYIKKIEKDLLNDAIQGNRLKINP